VRRVLLAGLAALWVLGPAHTTNAESADRASAVRIGPLAVLGSRTGVWVEDFPRVSGKESVNAVVTEGNGGFEFEKKLDVGNLLTSATILITLVALLNTLAKDRRGRERDFADRVRAAAATTLGKLDRWRQLSARLYEDVQPLIVDVSQKLHSELDASAARDLLWRELAVARAAAEQRIVDEDIESAYVALYPYHPSVQRRFADTMAQAKQIDDGVYFDFVKQTQQQVLMYESKPKDYRPAMLGNDLRLQSARASLRLRNELEQAFTPIRTFLVAVISLSDRDIAARTQVVEDTEESRGG
jgi:hypothetical protein